MLMTDLMTFADRFSSIIFAWQPNQNITYINSGVTGILGYTPEEVQNSPELLKKILLGPDFDKLREKYPAVKFLGAKFGRELAQHVAGGDVFIFPSRTDTFGLVLLEAMACGLPVAAYPVQGPKDVINNGVSGILDEDLGTAIKAALELKREDCIAHAKAYSWENCTASFESYLAPNSRLKRN